MNYSQRCRGCNKAAFKFKKSPLNENIKIDDRSNIRKLNGEKYKKGEFLMCCSCAKAPFFNKKTGKMDFSPNLMYED